jgi:hypothetical protein
MMELAGHVVRKRSSTKCKEKEKRWKMSEVRSHLADILVARRKILERIFETQGLSLIPWRLIFVVHPRVSHKFLSHLNNCPMLKKVL